MQLRRRFKQTVTLEERLSAFAKEARERAMELPPGFERDDLLRRARQANTAMNVQEWVSSPGLQPPR